MHSRYRPIRKLYRPVKQDYASLKSQEGIIKLFIQSSSQRRIDTEENMRSICPYEFNQTG